MSFSKRAALIPTVSRSELLDIARKSSTMNDGPLAVFGKMRKSRAKNSQPEHAAQVEYFQEIVPKLKEKYPVSAKLFDLTYANPNWVGLSKATINVGQFLKAEGKKAGVPDLTHPVARFQYHGLYVENKIRRQPISDEQTEWAYLLQKQGFAVVVCRAETPSELARVIGLTIGRYTVFDASWSDQINPKEAWL